MIVSCNDSIQLSGTDWKRRSLWWQATVENTKVLSVKTNNYNYRYPNNYGVKGVCLLPQINIKLDYINFGAVAPTSMAFV